MRMAIERAIVRLLGVILFFAGGFATAQTFPSKPIRFVVAYVPGGTTDIFARALGQKLSEQMGQPMLVDNRPGGNGFIAAEFVMRAPADGYTLWIADTGHLAISPAVRGKIPYDPLKDFAPVTLMMKQDFVLVVTSSLPVRNIQELIELSKSRPGGLNYGSVGSGSVHHLGFERLKQLTGAKLVHIPYKGNAQMSAPLISGEVHATVGGFTAVNQMLKAGTIRAIGIAAAERNVRFPDVPTLAESGVPGIEINIGVGLVAPAGTPGGIIHRLRDEIVRALKDPQLEKRNDALGFEIVGNTPSEYAEKIRVDLQEYRKIALDAKVKVE